MEFNQKRIFSTLIDHCIFGSVAAIIMFPGLVYDLITSPFGLKFHTGNIYLNSLALFIYVSKDIFAINSPGKKLMKLKLLPSSPNLSMNGYQLLVRNITFIIWPVEVVFEFLNPQRRLGDYFGKTKVLESNDKIHSGIPFRISSKIGALILSAAVCFLFQLQLMKLLEYLNENMAD